jgi:hypothetical protein
MIDMIENIEAELAAMRNMTATQLRAKYADLFGERSRSGNRQWLLRRCAWRLQSLAEGGLPIRRCHRHHQHLSRHARRAQPESPMLRARDERLVRSLRLQGIRHRRHRDGHDSMKPHHRKLHDQSASRQGSSPAGTSFTHRILPPGDWLAMLIQVVTVGLVRPCAGCKSRMASMNRTGWRGLAGLWIRCTSQFIAQRRS